MLFKKRIQKKMIVRKKPHIGYSKIKSKYLQEKKEFLETHLISPISFRRMENVYKKLVIPEKIKFSSIETLAIQLSKSKNANVSYKDAFIFIQFAMRFPRIFNKKQR
jgi:hypothetical protein